MATLDASLLEAAVFGLGVGLGAMVGIGALEFMRSRFRHLFGNGRERNDDIDGSGPPH